MFLVQNGNIYFVNEDQKIIYDWKLAHANVYLLRTWISICFSLDYGTWYKGKWNKGKMEMYKNGKQLAPDFKVLIPSLFIILAHPESPL